MLTGPIWYSASLPQRGNYPFSLEPRRPGKMARRDDRGSRLSGLGGGSRSGGEQMSQKRIEVQLTIRARAKMQRVTWATFLRSKRSAVWKISSSGTPYFLIAAWNLGKGKTDWVGHCIRFRLHDCHNRRNAHVSIDTFPLFPITSIDAIALSISRI